MVVELATAALGIGAAMYYAAGVPSSQVFGPSVVRGKPGAGRVALTFDDGPSESTPAVLDALGRHGARATFFMCGENVLRLPDIARRAAAEGHEIGNHTFRHPYLCRRLPADIRREIAEAQEAIARVTGRPPELFRPPYGVRWFGLYPALSAQGLRAVMWSACAYDWRRGAAKIEEALLEKTSDGAIVLLHDGDRTVPGDRRRGTALALDRALPVLAARGLRCVTISELLS